MKIKELIEKIDDKSLIFINGKSYSEEISEDILEKEINKINIEFEEKKKQDLESLGYSFEVGM